MYSDIVILRSLLSEPKHGYDIKKYVERATGGLLNNNTLYPRLRRFEQRGEIEKVAEETSPGRPPRTVYRITGEGRARLLALLRDVDPASLAKEEEFQVRVGHFDLMEDADRRRIIEARRAFLEHSLAAQEELAAGAGHHPWGLRVLRLNIDKHRLELAWLAELETAVGRADEQAGG
ncbi:PadR family transcriptional regulator [Nonomuraea sp. NPDC050783]|uniref:PadR family transcriptional regulator n=1 Tax=Nonomuraea sp. NPDC050783 TaxID=3154634 RepID=UPI0034661F66